MKRTLLITLAALSILALAGAGFAQSQDSSKGTIVIPPSSRGLAPGMPRTPLFIIIPESGPSSPPPGTENPGSLACIYGVTPPTSGCPLSGAPVATGGAKAIAVVEYGHNSTLQSLSLIHI